MTLVALVALALAACATGRFARVPLTSAARGVLAQAHTYYVRMGDRHAMACQTDAAYAQAHADCAGTALRHHPQARDLVQSALLEKNCRMVLVWEEPSSYAPGDRVGGIAAQPDGIARFVRPLQSGEVFLELQTESSSAGMFDETSGKRTMPRKSDKPFANATAQVFAPGFVQAVYSRAVRVDDTGGLKDVVTEVLEPLPDCEG